ncbi:MAG TPA: polysaccharide deacetylase family protein [Gammaproteobacteria bacterium]|nr:polysaccharide deacetylase family protein [Gammaproteobacteria bacterium]
MKMLIYYAAKHLGLFRLSRRLFRGRLLILCYHGFEVADEAAFMPGVFMRQATFTRRLQALAAGGHPVLPLAEALERLAAGTLPDNTICLTIDDGFYSVLDKAAPLLSKYGFPSTLYVTSYYVEKGTPVYRLVIQYLLWKTKQRTVAIEPARWGLRGSYSLTDPTLRAELCRKLIEYGEKHCNESARQQLCHELGELLGVSYQEILDDRRLSLLTPAEIRRLHQGGMDIQLHTRRHQLCGQNRQDLAKEVVENAHDLHAILPKPYAHFCYPSGAWQPHHPQWLEALGVASATTCDSGMNTAATNRLALYRVLDSESLRDIVFEAEINGFGELLRVLSGRRRQSDGWRQRAAAPSVEFPQGVLTAASRATSKESVAS